MDAFQITSLVFLGILVVGVIALIVIIYKSIVRHETIFDAQTKLLGRLIEIESALKSALPAIERSTGSASKYLGEALPAIERNTGSASKYLGEVLPAIERNTGAVHKYLADSLPATAKAAGDMAALLAVRLPALQESTSATEHSNAGILRGISEVATTITAVFALLDTLAKTHGEDAVGARATSLREELCRATAEMAALRKDLGEAVRF